MNDRKMRITYRGSWVNVVLVWTFIILKLTKVIDWSWYWIFFPFVVEIVWIMLVLVLVAAGISWKERKK